MKKKSEKKEVYMSCCCGDHVYVSTNGVTSFFVCKSCKNACEVERVKFHKPTSLMEEIEREVTVADILRWLDKLEKVKSKGAKVVMVSMLVRKVVAYENKKAVREAFERVRVEKEKGSIKVTKDGKKYRKLTLQEWSFNQALSEIEKKQEDYIKKL